MPIFVQSQGERLQYENAVAAISSDPNVSQNALKGARFTQSFLRMITPLVINQSTFVFNVLNIQTGSGLVRPDEQRLAQQDAFFVSKVTLYTFKSAAYNWTPNTYPNAVTYPTGSAQMNLLYTGYLKCTINNSTIVPAYPTRQFLTVPATQLTAAANSPQDAYDGVNLMPWEPNVVMVGLYQSQFTITIPAGLTAVDANTFIALECGGVLAQNVALGAPK